MSIDDHEAANLRLLANEVFGEENFVASITIMTNPKGRVLQEHFSQTHDYLLVYAKDSELAELSRSKTDDEITRDYPDTDEKGQRYRLLELRNTHRQFGKFNRPNLYFPIYVDPASGAAYLDAASGRTQVLPVWEDGFAGCWTWDRNKVGKDNALLLGKLVNGAWKVYRKAYAHTPDGDAARKKLKTIWLEREVQTEVGQSELDELMGNRVFPSPKPVGLIKTLLRLATNGDEEDLVLDFFSGTATTAHAVLALNAEDGGRRRFIVVQLPEPVDDKTQFGRNAKEAGFKLISDIGKERIRRVIKRLQADENRAPRPQPSGSLQFRSLRLDRSNFVEWKSFPDKDISQLEMRFAQAESPLIEGWQPDSVLTEILLLQGFPLDSELRALPEYAANEVKQAASEYIGHHLFICLDSKIKQETVAQIKLRAEDILVCLDSALSDEAKISLADRCNLTVI